MDPHVILGQDGLFPQHVSQEDHNQFLQQQAQEAQQQYLQHQAQQQQQLEEHQQQQHAQLLQQQIQQQRGAQQQQQQQTSTNLESIITMMMENQNKLVDGMNKLMMRLETTTTPPTVDQGPSRQAPPHIPTNPRTTNVRTAYEPSSPSEGAYARHLSRQNLNLKEPRIRDTLRFTGKSRLLRQFLLDVYDTLEQFANEFSSDKRRINWIAAHFVSNNNDVSPSQAWFLSLLMKNTHIHGIVDPYANLKSLEYVLPPLCSTGAFIAELISVFGDKTSSKTARQELAKCKQGNGSIVD